VISATALALLEPAGADELAAGAEAAGAEAVTGTDELEGDVAVDGLELLLLQAATVTARARPSARAMIRRAKRLNRTTRLLCLGRRWS
jgi:hypothetical protein